jgi:cell division protein FtsL
MIGLFNRRVRGFRVIEVAAFAVFLTTAMVVYLSKTGAGRDNAAIVEINQEIDDERRQLRLLSAEVAYLEQPERIERLSSQYLGLQPIAATREAQPEALPQIAQAALTPGPAQKKATP